MNTHWQRKKLADITTFLNRGISPKYTDIGGVRVLNQRCVRDHIVLFKNSRRHDSRAKAVPPERLLKLGDVLVNSTGTGTLGRVAQVRCEPDEPTTVDSHVTIVRPQPGLFYLDFFGYMATAIEDQIAEAGEGCGGQTELARSVLAERFQVTFPASIPEQRRIVGILDAAFEGIATAKANAEKNLLNARAIFESHLQSVFTKRGPGWIDRQLSSLCEQITVGHVGPMAAQYKDSGVPFLRSQNIRPFEVSLDNVTFIDDAFHLSLKKSRLRPGDLGIVRTGYPGTAAVIPTELPDANCSDLVIVRPNQTVNPHFLEAFFNSAFGKQLVLGKIVGAAQKHFNVTAAKQVMLHVPPLVEQTKIVERIDTLRTETKHLEFIFWRKLESLEALKKSLLHHAFSGELISADQLQERVA